MKRIIEKFFPRRRAKKNAEMQELLDRCARLRANGWEVNDINVETAHGLRLYCER